MAFYSTFFLAHSDQVQSAFPDWKPPLPEPVTRTSINPFTKEEVTTTTRAPAWDDFDPANIEFPEAHVVAIEGDYQTYLENRIPPVIQSLPHWCTKNLTSVELEPMVAAAGVPDATQESALYAHPAIGCGLEQFPDNFIALAKSASNAHLREIAEKWAQTMSTPEYTHSVSGKRLANDWSVDDALCLLNPIVKLLKQHSDKQSLYLLMEP